MDNPFDLDKQIQQIREDPIQQLTDRIHELEADKERLDWLEDFSRRQRVGLRRLIREALECTHVGVRQAIDEYRRCESLAGRDIRILEFSPRTERCLRKCQITSVEDLEMFSDKDLLEIREFGKICLEEVRAKVQHKPYSK